MKIILWSILVVGLASSENLASIFKEATAKVNSQNELDGSTALAGLKLPAPVIGSFDAESQKNESFGLDMKNGAEQRTVTVIKSNVSQKDEDELSGALQRIYNNITGSLDRALAFSDKLQEKYPKYANSVVINYNALIYYSKYFFIHLQIDYDNVFAFGFK